MGTDRLRRQLDEIRALRDDPASPEAVATLRKALAKAPSHAVAAAAKHVAEHGLRELGDELVRAWDRLAPGGVKADPGCAGKQALVEALSALDHPDPRPLVAAVETVQLEKGFGPPVDTAIGVRGHALMALVGLASATRPCASPRGSPIPRPAACAPPPRGARWRGRPRPRPGAARPPARRRRGRPRRARRVLRGPDPAPGPPTASPPRCSATTCAPRRPRSRSARPGSRCRR
ncbi:MAG: hypothetical protein R3F59_05400 [Myxococcota bacterium]